MLTTEFSIPVSVEVDVSDILQGIFEIEGLLTYADEVLTIEYQRKELFSRSSNVSTLDLSLDTLREVILKKGIPGPKLILRPRRLSAFTDVPISSNAEIVLKVKWSNRKEAEALVAQVQRALQFRSQTADPSRILFRAADVGLREIKGALYLEDDEFLVIDIENALVGEFDTKRQLIKVAPRALKEVRLEERRFRDRLYVRPNGPDLLEAMPGSHVVELELKIHPKYREHVDRLLYDLDRLRHKSSSSDETDEDTAGSPEESDVRPGEDLEGTS